MSAAGSTLASIRLADQRRHQVRLARKRMTWWIPLTFVAGLGVKPLSAFGCADDYYEQEVSWHSASEGIRSIEALLQGLGALPSDAPGLAVDLRTLASVVRIAADQGIDFSLMLRISAKDSVQVVRTREVRQGSFW